MTAWPYEINFQESRQAIGFICDAVNYTQFMQECNSSTQGILGYWIIISNSSDEMFQEINNTPENYVTGLIM